MKKVLIATQKPFSPVAVEKIKEVIDGANYEFLLLENYLKSSLIEMIPEVDAVIIRSDIIDKEVLDAAKNLKIVVRAGAGYDNVDLNAASENDVVVMNTPGQNSNAVAELALGMMVYLARNQYNGKAGTELRGKKLGIHAFGNVGRLIARIASGFGMDVYVFDPFVDKVVIETVGFKPLSYIDELYSTCQYISLNIPANKQTKGSINHKIMSLMPEGATIVNTARKEVIHEESLLQIFEERKDFKYISDIAPDCAEKIEKEYPGRFFFTPKKMGAQTAEANVNAGIAAARQIVNFFEKGDTTFQVNK